MYNHLTSTRLNVHSNLLFLFHLISFTFSSISLTHFCTQLYSVSMILPPDLTAAMSHVCPTLFMCLLPTLTRTKSCIYKPANLVYVYELRSTFSLLSFGNKSTSLLRMWGSRHDLREGIKRKATRPLSSWPWRIQH